MAKKEKRTIVLAADDERGTAVEAMGSEVDEKESRMAEERKKCEGMSKDDLINYLLQTKENLDCSYEQREKIEKENEATQASNRELQAKVSSLEKDKRELDDKLTAAENKIKNLEAEADKVKKLNEQITELKENFQDKENAAKNAQLNLERSHKADKDKFVELTDKLRGELSDLKAENKKLKSDLKRAEQKVERTERDFEIARNANFAGMIVRDIPREMDLQFESVDEQVKELFDALMTDVRDRYLSVANGVIESADRKIFNQETAAEQLKKAEKDLQDSEDLSKLADQRRKEALKRAEEARKNFIEAKDEA